MLEMRARILEIFPDAEEEASYGMPAFKVGGNIVAGLLANETYVGYYPFSGSVLPNFRSEFSQYFTTLSALHIPLDKPLPKPLLKKLIRARLYECKVKQTTVNFKKHETQDSLWRDLHLAAPARRTLVENKIFTLNNLTKNSETDLLQIHGIGPNTLIILKKALKKHKMGFSK